VCTVLFIINSEMKRDMHLFKLFLLGDKYSAKKHGRVPVLYILGSKTVNLGVSLTGSIYY
jgi:hypothetical protein